MHIDKMDEIVHILRRRCETLISKTNILNSDIYASLPLTRYILSIPCSIPVEHIILAERPYLTDIFPYVAPAMAYDSNIQMDTTPIVHFLALDISNGSDLSYDICRDWFRDSWKYLNKGIISLNVCILHTFMSNESERERVAIEEFIRDIIHTSLILSDNKIHIYALGNPARHSANRIRSSISRSKSQVVIHQCKNPASFQHKLGDKMSPDFTIGAKAITKLFTKLIKDTISSGNILSEKDYFKMATGEAAYNKVNTALNNTRDAFKEIAKYFKENTGETVKREPEIFERAVNETTQLIDAFSNARIRLLFVDFPEPSGGAKPSFTSKRSNYNKGSFTKGTSSKASTTISTAKQKIAFVDDDIPMENVEAEDISSSVNTSSAINTPQTSTTARTPIPVRQKTYAKSIAEQSSVTHRTTNVGFADEDDDDNDINVTQTTSTVATKSIENFNIDLNDMEKRDFSFISDFIDENGEYKVNTKTIEAINDTIRSGRATSNISQEVTKIIRNTHANPSTRSIMNALGLEDNIIDMSSDIMQWILKNIVEP